MLLDSYNVKVFIVCMFISIALSLTTPVWIPADVVLYMDMVKGSEVADPWNSRWFIPWVISLIGGTYEAFCVFNILVFVSALYVYACAYDLKSTIVFVVGAYPVLQIVIQVPMLESAILLMIVCSLYLTKRMNKELWFIPLCILGALVHPVSFVFVTFICLMSVSKKRWWVLIPGCVTMLLVFPVGYGEIMSFVNIYKTMLLTVGIFWIGLVGLKKDRDSLMIVLAMILCLGFAMVATYTEKMMYYAGLFLAPKVCCVVLGDECGGSSNII